MKSENERKELHRIIWDLANKLRGSVDGWDFKQYVLGLLFYKYISDDFTRFINKTEHESNFIDNYDYAKDLDDDYWQDENIKNELIQSKGLFISPNNLFDRIVESAEKDVENSNLNEKLKKIFDDIESSSQQGASWFKGLFKDIDLNSEKLGDSVIKRNKKILEIMTTIQKITLLNDDSDETEIDIFGDSYEFLMHMYASDAGKRGGEFYTPPEVSELLVKLTKVAKTNKKDKTIKVYDPACGSGSLLLKFVKIYGNKEKTELYGQEINLTTYNLCKMNMILHSIQYSNIHIELGDTLTDNKHEGEKFDAIISNPPYSTKWKGSDDIMLIKDPRFNAAGVLAPKSKADMAFIMHSLYHLSNDGVAVIICFPGIMYRSGAEQKIRKYLIDNNYIDCVIQLGENFFYGTSISTCVLIIKKQRQDNKVLFINAEEQFEKVKNRNILTKENIDWILEKYENRRDEEYKSRLVETKEIEEQNYVLSVSSYIDKKEEREEINILDLNKKIQESVQKIELLRKNIDETIKELEESEDFFISKNREK